MTHFDEIKVARNKTPFWNQIGTVRHIGAVLLITSPRGYALVRKASKQGYEFSQKLTLPGGMVRPLDTESFEHSIVRSVLERAEAEAGIHRDILQSVNIAPQAECPVTAYSVKGVLKYTVMIPVIAHSDVDFELGVDDPSVAETFWHDSTKVPWEQLAPGNCIIIHNLLASKLSKSTLTKGSSAIEKAKQKVNYWASQSS